MSVVASVGLRRESLILSVDTLHQLVAHGDVAQGLERRLEASVDIAKIVGQGLRRRVGCQQLAHHGLVVRRERRIAAGLTLDKGQDLLG